MTPTEGQQFYDPNRDPRSCDCSRGDIQCPYVMPRGFDDGYLNCAFTEGHAGDHHIPYLSPRPDFYARCQWMTKQEWEATR